MNEILFSAKLVITKFEYFFFLLQLLKAKKNKVLWVKGFLGPIRFFFDQLKKIYKTIQIFNIQHSNFVHGPFFKDYFAVKQSSFNNHIKYPLLSGSFNFSNKLLLVNVCLTAFFQPPSLSPIFN